MATQPNPEQEKLLQVTEKTIRLVRPSVVVLVGPAACGKSTFAERHFRATQIISSDWARGRVCDDERDQRYQPQAFALVHFLIEQRLGLNRLCVVDSTALTTQARRDLLDLARKYQVPSVALLFDIPLEKCFERDESRERKVGRAVIERQYEVFQQAKAAIRQEGFEQVLDLRDEDLDKVRIEVIFRPVARAAPVPARSGPGAWQRTARQGGSSPAGPVGPRSQAPARPSPYAHPDLARPPRTSGTERPSGGPDRARQATDQGGPTVPLPHPTEPPPPAPGQVAPAPPSKPNLPGPAAGAGSPPASPDPATPLQPGTTSGGPQEPGKT